jgi:hypothetical protein
LSGFKVKDYRFVFFPENPIQGFRYIIDQQQVFFPPNGVNDFFPAEQEVGEIAQHIVGRDRVVVHHFENGFQKVFELSGREFFPHFGD